jgi:tetratricopeptide (TPR) repeat protein
MTALAGLTGTMLVAFGCSPFAGTRVREAAGGQYVVEVGRSMTCESVAREVYGDANLGPAIAELNRLPVDSPIPAGTVLVLPRREGLVDRLGEERQVETSFREGLAAADAGRFREAAELFQAALRLDPARHDVQYNLGLALQRTGDLEEATSVLVEAARRRPDDPQVRYALGSVLRQRGAYERALKEFDDVLDLRPEDSAAAFARARTLGDLGRVPDARQAWQEFLRRFPEDPWVERAKEHVAALDAEESVTP